MPARGDLVGRALDLQIQRALRQVQAQMIGQVVRSNMVRTAARALVQQHTVSLQQAYGRALAEAQREGSERVKQVSLRGVNEIERATIGATAAARRDNAEISAIMQKYAETTNKAILENYIASFSGRSYRTSDPSRRSGKIEAFLRQQDLAIADGMSVTVSLAPAVGNADVPHIFRLNYGTEADPGSKKGNKAGAQPPVVRISLFDGSKVFEKVATAGREAPMGGYPGRGSMGGPTFPFILKSVGAGARPAAVQLYGIRGGAGGLSERRPASGVAPSYFVERGMAEAARILPQAHRDLLNRWRQRVDRIRGSDAGLT